MHPFQVCAPECAGACRVPDVMDQPAIVLCTMQPPALPLALSASASGASGVPDSDNRRPLTECDSEGGDGWASLSAPP